MADRILDSFKIRSGNNFFDYRVGGELDTDEIKAFFLKKGYQVKSIRHGGRHVLGVLIKNDTAYFLKLSTSRGISIVTQNELEWNNYFNKYFPTKFPFRVPVSYESGFYQRIYFYLITDYFDGKLLCEIDDVLGKSNNLTQYLDQVIKLSELIQKLPVIKFANYQKEDYRERLRKKVNGWFGDIPANICREYDIKDLLGMVERKVDGLLSKPRHGDFAPWHIFKLAEQRFGLIDGEHALTDGVESYDICYFIQWVFSVLKNPDVAKLIYYKLVEKGYSANKLKTVLAARAIGGFLDESLKNQPDYKYADNFKDWVIKI